MGAETTPFDPATYIETPEAAIAYTDDALATGDDAFVADAREVVARAEKLRNQRPAP
jgi:DNA-binding phage protein